MTMALQSRRRRAPESVLIAATRLTPKVLPALPDVVKRLVSGGRAVVIDGNTLDPTLQAFTASLRMAGITGLVTDDDVALSRRLMLALCRGLGGHRLLSTGHDLSLPGPAGPVGAAPLPCRRGRCPGAGASSTAAATPSATWTATTHCAGCCATTPASRCSRSTTGWPPNIPAPAAVDDCLAAFRWVTAHADEFGVRPDRSPSAATAPAAG